MSLRDAIVSEIGRPAVELVKAEPQPDVTPPSRPQHLIYAWQDRAEIAVLVGCLGSVEYAQRALSTLQERDFDLEWCRQVWRGMVRLYDRGQAPTMLALYRLIDFENYLRLTNAEVDGINPHLVDYIATVKQQAQTRRHLAGVAGAAEREERE